MKKRVLSLFMALALCFSMLPTAALATENTTEPSTQLTETTSVPEEPGRRKCRQHLHHR